MKLTGAQILWDCLVREGVTEIFGYPGGAILPAYDAMLDYPIRHTLVRHEQGATHMADGYARATGRVGVAIATSGPGATNMVTGIATAMLDSSPIVCITGQVGSRLIGTDAFQEIDITGITLPVTKHNYLVTRAQDVAAAVREAFQIAQEGRPGPVLIDITKDAQQSSCEFDWDAAAPVRRARRETPLPAHADLARAAALVQGAKRPVILAGHGVTISGAEHALKAFAERAHIPVAQTLLGIGGLPASQSRASSARTRLTQRRSTSRSTRPRSTRTSRSTSRSSETCAASSIDWCRSWRPAIGARGSPRSKPRAAIPPSATSSRSPTTAICMPRT